MRRRSAFALAAVAASSVVVTAPPDVGAARATSHLRLGGAAHGSVTVLRVVCNTHVATSKHKFFFDIGGTAGGTFLFSGDVVGYTGPATYHSFSGLVMTGGHYFTGHGSSAGTVKVGSGATSATVNLRLKEPQGEGGAAVTVAGAFRCTAYTTA